MLFDTKVHYPIRTMKYITSQQQLHAQIQIHKHVCMSRFRSISSFSLEKGNLPFFLVCNLPFIDIRIWLELEEENKFSKAINFFVKYHSTSLINRPISNCAIWLCSLSSQLNECMHAVWFPQQTWCNPHTCPYVSHPLNWMAKRPLKLFFF